MSIVLEKIDETTIKAVVTVAVQDYAQEVEDQIKRIRKNIQLPGFRQGNVPRSIIEKKHGAQLRFEAVSQHAFDAFSQQLKEENYHPMGHFMIESVEPENQFSNSNDDYVLTLTAGVVAPYELELDEKIELPYYSVDSVDEKVEESLNQALASLSTPEEVDNAQHVDTLIYGNLRELDADGKVLEGGVQKESAMIMPRYVENEEQIRTLTPKSTMVINPYSMYKENAPVIAHFLGIDKEDVENHKGDFSFEVTSITAPKQPEINEDTIKKILGEETEVATEEGLRKEMTERIEAFQKTDSDYLFSTIFFNYLREVEVPKVKLPEERLKSSWRERIEDGKSEEEQNKMMEDSINMISTFFIIDYLAQKYAVEISPESVENTIRQEVIQSISAYLPYLGDRATSFVEDMVSRRMKEENENHSVERSMRLFEVSKQAQSLIKMKATTLSLKEYEERKREIEKREQPEVAQEA